MNSDDWIARNVRWAKFAPSDLKLWKIKRKEWAVITQLIDEVAATECYQAHWAVKPIHCTDDMWYEIKITDPSQIRVLFSIEQDDRILLVHAVMRRTDGTFNIAETLYEIAEAKAA